MSNPFNNLQFNKVPQNQSNCTFNSQVPCDLKQLVEQARQDPQTFENFIKQNNPQGYQQALNIMNSGNPRQLIMQLASAKGIPSHILRMLGIK